MSKQSKKDEKLKPLAFTSKKILPEVVFDADGDSKDRNYPINSFIIKLLILCIPLLLAWCATLAPEKSAQVLLMEQTIAQSQSGAVVSQKKIDTCVQTIAESTGEIAKYHALAEASRKWLETFSGSENKTGKVTALSIATIPDKFFARCRNEEGDEHSLSGIVAWEYQRSKECPVAWIWDSCYHLVDHPEWGDCAIKPTEKELDEFLAN